MSKREVKTDLWVAGQLDKCGIQYTPQGSDVKEIGEALSSASKRGTGKTGFPEYVAVVNDFVIVIEDKADLGQHTCSQGVPQMVKLDERDWKDFAVPEIFQNIQRGKRLKNADHIPGIVPYVSSTANNNGVDDYIEATEGTRVLRIASALPIAEVLVPRSMSHLRLWRATILRVLNVKKQMSIFTCS